MLILVSVTISMAVNGGLFGYAGRAASETKNAMNDEKSLGSGYLETTIDGHTFSSIEEINQYFKNGTVPVTTEDILGFIEDDDILMWNPDARQFTEKLKWMGEYWGNSGTSEWASSTVYRCSLDNKIYIVGTKVGDEEETVEVLDWDGTTVLGNDGYPTTISTSFGDYQSNEGRHQVNEGEFDLQLDQFGVTRLFLSPHFNNYCILCYAEDGWLIDIEWKD